MTFPHFILASASPARRKLLQGIGIDPAVQPSAFDESSVTLSDPVALVETLARRKAETVAGCWTMGQHPTLVLGCDSVLVVKGKIHGKPQSPEEALARWREMSGQAGDLVTGHALIDLNRDRLLLRSQSTRVQFARVSDAEIRSYIATGEPMNCAGGFTLEGRGGGFIEQIQGCYSNVMGLSLPLLRQMLLELGFDLTAAWSMAAVSSRA